MTDGIVSSQMCMRWSPNLQCDVFKASTEVIKVKWDHKIGALKRRKWCPYKKSRKPWTDLSLHRQSRMTVWGQKEATCELTRAFHIALSFKSHSEQTKPGKFTSLSPLHSIKAQWRCSRSPYFLRSSPWNSQGCSQSKRKRKGALSPPLTHPLPTCPLRPLPQVSIIQQASTGQPAIYQVSLWLTWWQTQTEGAFPPEPMEHGDRAGEGVTQMQVCHEDWDCLQPHSSIQGKDQSRLHQHDFITICSSQSCSGR